ncbi:hypothetical protein D0Y65_035764 [Glycine soja]|uniref:Uncharacterized protein n=1 Tax=Glycine soja TaxID=3848 RepID=A0A445HBG9_GLYSO|nr:hypothetical protein D0Y65_035764 [Glycine soja]
MLSTVIHSALGYPAFTMMGMITGTPEERPSRQKEAQGHSSGIWVFSFVQNITFDLVEQNNQALTFTPQI